MSSTLPAAAARIRVDVPRRRPSAWCWREDWLCGGESIYSLLALFEGLNVLEARQVTDAFIEPVPTGRNGYVKVPTVDLRSPRRFRIARFAGATRLSVDAVTQGFVTEAFPHSGWRGEMSLRWCPQCAKAGYHCAMFQLPFVYECPAHGCPLLSSCPRCRSMIPYKLSGASVAAVPLFCCPQCKLDLAPQLHRGTHKLALSKQQAYALQERSRLMQFCDRLPMVAAELLNGGRPASIMDLMTSIPEQRVSARRFTAFVTQAMASLKTSPHADWQHLEPSCSFAEPRAARARRLRSTTRTATGWPDHLVARTDKNLTLAAEVYRCVRRHLWRTAVRAHQRCVWSTVEHIWWPVTGSTTAAFCPVAATYLRWRVQWEGTAVVTALRAEPTSAPLGLVTWLASAAPMGPATWTMAARSWLMREILGRDLLLSFDEMLLEEAQRKDRGKVSWTRAPAQGLPRSCWVCAGRGTAASPARLFVLPPDRAGTASGEATHGKGHYQRQLATLKSIQH